MHPFESLSAPAVIRLERARRAGEPLGRPPGEVAERLASQYRQVCRDDDLSLLLLAALGRRRGPLD
jgi:hypothetical protein